MMTEDEAKKKWCPHSGTKDEKTGTCIASRCMAWRHGRKMFQLDDGRLIDPRDGIRGDINYKRVRLGYCGLAGNPS